MTDDAFVQVGTWLLPSTYGTVYDHFTQTRMKAKRDAWVPMYAKVADLRTCGWGEHEIELLATPFQQGGVG